ncbi:phenylalanine--tRNA ligase subunit beta [Candidatus Woesebacteria bacterium RIFCSPHIGHO2_01_FULL_38_9]|uniref:phenylalanine--tRNA ligase n=1 Tax=Candidatus Woesebacteria bacterium RIFCSPHIGHO2_01_FULL_38_9 TaxID=1802492 RepID=A0A1F7Y2G7_9BACT|nr:MAG: phenylalanine--tRNA ligase subunit beta [Candidatus Woesebacteria bacterium RIFCSPHIGHO2_01_FULL_38_9]
MDILVPDEWLREYLETDAKPKEIMRYLSLCGPTVDRIHADGSLLTYQIEVTTNRVDSASIYGIAREAAAILPRFGFSAKLKPIPRIKLKEAEKLDFHIKNNPKLCKRILAIKLTDVTIRESPDWMKKRLFAVDQRPLNNLVDITNYVMWEVGHPIHVFDYDKLSEKTIVVREADRGESLISLDQKVHKLLGGEVVFDDGTGEIIDLPGIMGTENSVVGPDTKNILLWIESIDPVKIRQTSMAHMIRTQAAILNEKAVDPELGKTAILRATGLYKKLANAKVASSLYDLNENPFKGKEISLSKDFIDERIGVALPKEDVKNYLTPLGFEISWQLNTLKVKIPSGRAADINISEDIVEEIARIYGYHNLPSELMSGKIPQEIANPTFAFEQNIKKILKGWGGVEVYNYSMVPNEWVDNNALKLANSLGTDTEYMRTNLRASLIASAKLNSGETDPYHLFEIANVYLPKKDSLPDERIQLAGVFVNHSYREAKGIIEALLDELIVEAVFIPEDEKGFLPSKKVVIKSSGKILGELGILEDGNFIYYSFDIASFLDNFKQHKTFIPISKYPPQIEDITLKLPQRTRVSDLISSIKLFDKKIVKAELVDIFKDSYTLCLWYQHPQKTLTDGEVKAIREVLIKKLKVKFGVEHKL